MAKMLAKSEAVSILHSATDNVLNNIGKDAGKDLKPFPYYIALLI